MCADSAMQQIYVRGCNGVIMLLMKYFVFDSKVTHCKNEKAVTADILIGGSSSLLQDLRNVIGVIYFSLPMQLLIFD